MPSGRGPSVAAALFYVVGIIWGLYFSYRVVRKAMSEPSAGLLLETLVVAAILVAAIATVVHVYRRWLKSRRKPRGDGPSGRPSR